MKVKDVMTYRVETVSPTETLEQAAQKMRMHVVGFLPVVDEGQIVGVVTDRDIVMRGVAEGLRPYMTRVCVVMTPNVLSCYEDQMITEAARVMERNLVRRLVVLDRNEKLVGVVSLDDFAAKMKNDSLAADVLNKVAAA